MTDMTPHFPETSSQILCYYSNHTSQVQIALIHNIPQFRLEQVLFPGQRWMFQTLPEAILEIYGAQAGVLTCLQQIPCRQLQVIEQVADPIGTT
ncbi:MAG TPA: DUF1830 domain-containing protein [Leptolyngbyaceae cyanobacterium]